MGILFLTVKQERCSDLLLWSAAWLLPPLRLMPMLMLTTATAMALDWAMLVSATLDWAPTAVAAPLAAHAIAAPALGYAGLGYAGLGYAGLGYGHYYGKREAEAEPKADAYYGYGYGLGHGYAGLGYGYAGLGYGYGLGAYGAGYGHYYG